jgi:hypothetical protein
MKKKYEHRPGLFGLASIAFGCAAKDGEARNQRNPTLPHGHNEAETERRPEPVKNNICNQSNRRRSGAGR